LATNKNNSAIPTPLPNMERNQPNWEWVEQQLGLDIFVADIREELIDKILKPLVDLEELAGDPDTNLSLAHHCQWRRVWKSSSPVPNTWSKRDEFFDTENLQRLKSIPHLEVSTRFMPSVL